MSDRFDELVDHQALSPEERARLRRVHDLLLEVGPPPEAPAALPPPAAPVAEVVALRRLRRPLTLLAAALAAAAAGGAGYVLGDRAAGGDPVAQPATTETRTTTVTSAPAGTQPRRGPLVAMTGVGAAQGASATVEILPRASSGDYPVRIQVRGLASRQTYELWVVKDGELEQLCGRFTTSEGLTDAVVAVPYKMRTRDDWVVVRPGSTEPLLRT